MPKICEYCSEKYATMIVQYLSDNYTEHICDDCYKFQDNHMVRMRILKKIKPNS